jgi:putative redox protein
MNASLSWHGGLSFEATADTGFQVRLGASPAVGGADDGFRPMELLLIGLAGCTAMDVMSILRKKRQDVTHFQVLAHAEQAQEHPRVFTRVVIEYVVRGHQVDKAAVERAIELSRDKYCPAQAMLAPTVEIEHTYRIEEEQTSA